MVNCLNCDTKYAGNYCPNCGQKSSTSRLTAKVILGELFHLLTHIEKTFLSTTLDLIIRPGITSLNFLDGKRQRYQKPVSYFLIWTGIFILVHNLIINGFDYELVLQDTGQSARQMDANALLRKHFTLFSMPILLISAILTWLVMGRPKFHFAEIFTLILFGGGTYFFLNLISDILLGLIFRVNINHYKVFLWQTLLSAVYNIWFTFDFFSRAHVRYFVVRMLLTAALISLSGKLVMDYIPLWWIQWMK